MNSGFPLQMLGLAIEQAYNAVLVIDPGNDQRGPHIVYANPRFLSLSGYMLEEVMGCSPEFLIGPQTDRALLRRMRAAVWAGEIFQGISVNYRKDGSSYHVEWTVSPVRDGSGEIRCFMAFLQDVSARIEAEAQRDLMASALTATAACVLICDTDGAIVFANQAMAAQTGYSIEELVGQRPDILKSGKHDPAFYARMWQHLVAGQTFRATFTNRRKDGSIFHCEQTISPALDASGRLSHYISISKDVSERVGTERDLREQASRDVLTGLYNRRYGEQRLRSCCSEARERGGQLSLMLCDIDHFKSINDSFGHAAGDFALQACSQTIQNGVRQSDIAVRWGGEEFLVILPDCDLEAATQLAERLRQNIRIEAISGVRSLTLSIGVATVGADETPDQAVARADQAMYRAKRAGRNRVELALAVEDC
jgi:diguanylate cyclase (GGDEF)-like protein/PAS domain S-box-containing protein